MAATQLMSAVPDDPTATDDGVARLRIPPHAREAEQAILGGILLDNKALAAATDVITAGDFYRHEHRLIFDAICDLVTDGVVADVVTVFERLDANGTSRDVGGLPYLNDLAQSVPSGANTRRYAEVVRERATLRRLIAASDEIATAAFNTQGRRADDLLEEGFSKLRSISSASPSGRSLPLLGYEELRAHAQAVSWLVKGIVQADAIGVLFGASGTFKTYLALDLALHVVHGLRWLGRRTQQGPVVIIAGEGGSGVFTRLEAWHRARRLKPPGPDMLRVIPVAVDLGNEAWRVAEAAQMAGITPALVIVDTLSQTFSGEENSAPEVAAYLRELGNRFRALWHCTVLVLHHSGHSQTDRPRGSTAIQANTSFLMGCFRDEKQLLATLTSVHMKEGATFDDAVFELRQQQLGNDADGDPISQLVARHLSSAEEVQDAMAEERKAGRGGHNQLIVSLAQNGMKEADLRRAFYEDCDADTSDARRQAYHRARKWATSRGFFEVAEGFVLVTSGGARA